MGERTKPNLTKTTLRIRQVEDHVSQDLTSSVPTICVLLSTPFQECISNFGVYRLLLENTTITEKNMRVSLLESSVLGKPEEMIM
jgi:hypothetical protein